MYPSFQLKDNTAFKNRQPSISLDTGLNRCIVRHNEAWRHTEQDQAIVQCELAMIEQLEFEKDTINRNPVVQVPIEIDLVGTLLVRVVLPALLSLSTLPIGSILEDMQVTWATHELVNRSRTRRLVFDFWRTHYVVICVPHYSRVRVS